ASGSPDTNPTPTNPAQCTGTLQPNPGFVPALLAIDLTRGGADFNFHGRGDIRQLAMYVQDAITKGNWTFNLGVRGDLYRGLSRDVQIQPRLGLAYNIKPSNTVLRLSYARVMETPFNENLVFASQTTSDPVISALFGANSNAAIRPGARNEFHAGFQQAFAKFLVVDADYMWKYTHNG